MQAATRKYARVASALATFSLIAGCAGSVDNRDVRIRVETDPPGATAYASGRKIGITPLSIDPGDYFTARPVFGGADAMVAIRYVGILSLEKAGCETHDIAVDDGVLARDIHATLVCDGTVTVSTPPPANPQDKVQRAGAAGVATPVPVQSPRRGSAEARLIRIEALHEKGLLTDEEYRMLRRRILETL